MLYSTLLALSCLGIAYAAPSPRAPHGLKRAEDSHVLNLKRVGTKAASSRALLLDAAPDTAVLNPAENGAGFGVTVTLGQDDFDVVLDTGSSDLWVFNKGVQCINSNGRPTNAEKCGFGPKYSGNFGDGTVKGENFLISYGSGEAVVGKLGYDDITIGGVTVKKQEFALVDQALWSGDGKVSGIFGFAYSSLTSAYQGNNPSKDQAGATEPYSNWLSSAITAGTIDPVFSLVLERDGGNSQLALGGLPTINFDQTFATTDIIKEGLTKATKHETQFTYYTIKPDGFKIGGKTMKTDFPAIVDSGTTLLYVPADVAKAINKAYDPPSKYIKESGVYENSCDAKPPSVSITIGGVDLKISSSELLLQNQRDSATNGCLSGIQPGTGNYAILGDVFLENVVAVFDVGKKQMKFAAHTDY